MKNKKIIFAGLVVSMFVAVVFTASAATKNSKTPTIKVVSPNGGEVWKAGTKKDIVFKGNLKNEPFAINLRGVDQGTDSFIGQGVTPSKGEKTTFYWKIPATTEPRNDYKILVRYTNKSNDLNDGMIYDESDKPFTIKGSSATASSSLASYKLKINKSGKGYVSTEDNRIACGTDCKEEYKAGDTVNLTATANDGYVFKKFEPEKECPIIGKGGGVGTDTYTVCQTTMDKNKTITAVFKKTDSSSSKSSVSSKSSGGVRGGGQQGI